MTKHLNVLLVFPLLFAGCGGGQTATQTPAEEADSPTGQADESAGNGDLSAGTSAGESDGDGEASAEASAPETEPSAQAAADPAPSAQKPDAASAPTPAKQDDVKEASEARITDKHIVISGKVLFETGNAKLKKVSHKVLDEVVFAMEKHPEIIKLQVVGHTDSDGDAKANKRLSQRRANAVMKYLIKKGIERDRLSALGEGEDVPIASNDTEEGKDKNRRVEFNIVERAKVVAVTHSTTTVKPGAVKSKKATDDETEAIIKKKGLDKKAW